MKVFGTILIASASLLNGWTAEEVKPSAATNVVITDNLPAGLTVVSSNSSQGSLIIGGGTVIITNISLAPSAGLIAILRVTPGIAGTAVNTAVATSAQADLDLPSNTAQVSTSVQAPLRAKLDIVAMANQQFQITLTGDAGQIYVLQGSSNLVNWAPVFTGTAAPNGSFKFTTTNGASFNYRFFRSVRLP